jgi:hypothetical protein
VEYVAIVSKTRKSIIRLMHIELQPDKRYYSIGEIQAFDVNASHPFWDSEFDILKPKKNAKETGCLLLTSKICNLFIIW